VPVQYNYTSTPPTGRTACTERQCLYSTAIPLLPLWAVRPVQNLSACTVQLYLYSPQCLYKGAPCRTFYLSQEMWKVWVQIHVRPYVKHTCQWVDFHEARHCPTVFCREILQWIPWKCDRGLVADTISQSDRRSLRMKTFFFTSYRTRNKISCPVHSNLTFRRLMSTIVDDPHH